MWLACALPHPRKDCAHWQKAGRSAFAVRVLPVFAVGVDGLWRHRCDRDANPREILRAVAVLQRCPRHRQERGSTAGHGKNRKGFAWFYTICICRRMDSKRRPTGHCSVTSFCYPGIFSVFENLGICNLLIWPSLLSICRHAHLRGQSAVAKMGGRAILLRLSERFSTPLPPNRATLENNK